MSSMTLADRGKSLEDAFFARQNAEAMRRLAEQADASPQGGALAEASGISDPAVLDRLSRLGLSLGNLAALTLVPLVAVAWADGRLEEPERGVLRFDAARLGLEPGHSAHGLVQIWLDRKPEPDLFDAWKAYVAALPAETRAALAPSIVARSRAVAEAAGGVLGLGRTVSSAERGVLDEVATALSER